MKGPYKIIARFTTKCMHNLKRFKNLANEIQFVSNVIENRNEWIYVPINFFDFYFSNFSIKNGIEKKRSISSIWSIGLWTLVSFQLWWILTLECYKQSHYVEKQCQNACKWFKFKLVRDEQNHSEQNKYRPFLDRESLVQDQYHIVIRFCHANNPHIPNNDVISGALNMKRAPEMTSIFSIWG